jgi:hypothetical protein
MADHPDDLTRVIVDALGLDLDGLHSVTIGLRAQEVPTITTERLIYAPSSEVLLRELTERFEMVELTEPGLRARAHAACQILLAHGQTDGAHHKAWVIDQAVRALTGPDYEQVIADARSGDDGPDTYAWDEGTAP